jgi:hypothetical protein
MNHDISEEAKRALAGASRRKAIDRLHNDGCSSREAIQRRVLAIAVERSLPPADYTKLLDKWISTLAAMAFCEKHKVSMDWGCSAATCRGLQRMTKEAKAEPPEMTETQRKEVTRLILALSRKSRQLRSASCVN